jgi:hypothetical protein
VYLILVYVDDILIASVDENYISEIKKEICAEYDMTDMRELDSFLNAKITRSREKILISQTFDFLMQGKTTKSPLPIDVIEQLATAPIQWLQRNKAKCIHISTDRLLVPYSL